METKAARPTAVFFGTPEFAVPVLEALFAWPDIQVLGVVTQPDRPAGRGQKLAAPPVKVCAQAHNLPVLQPLSLKSLALAEQDGAKTLSGEKSSSELAAFLNGRYPIDILLTCAYGKILPPALLSLARCGMVNVHPSLLPRWRGAAPLQRAIFAGDRETGVAIMEVDEGLDTGPVYALRKTELRENETAGTLHDRLAVLGAELLVEVLPDILRGTAAAVPQEERGATYADKWEGEDLEIHWGEPAAISARRIRACCPVPGARTRLGDAAIKVYAAHEVPDQNQPAAPAGTIVEVNRAELIVSCGERTFLSLDELQFPGKNRLSIAEVLRGRAFRVGDAFA